MQSRKQEAARADWGIKEKGGEVGGPSSPSGLQFLELYLFLHFLNPPLSLLSSYLSIPTLSNFQCLQLTKQITVNQFIARMNNLPLSS